MSNAVGLLFSNHYDLQIVTVVSLCFASPVYFLGEVSVCR